MTDQELTLAMAWAEECDRLRAALRRIVDEGDYTAPEGMKRIANDALKVDRTSGGEGNS